MGTLGYRRIRDTLLLQTGWSVCDLSVWKSMQRLGIKGYTRKSRHPSPPGHEHKDTSNVLGRRFYAEAPLQKVVSDIAYMRQGVSRSMTVRFRSRLFHFSRVPR